MAPRFFSTASLACCIALWASTAAADDNDQSPSCPFPSSSSTDSDLNGNTTSPGDDYGDSSSSSSGDYGGSSSWDSDDDHDHYDSGSGCSGGGWDPGPLLWPSFLDLRLVGGVGSTAWDEADFGTPDGDFSVPGGELGVGRVVLGGGELVLDVAPNEHLRIGVGAGFYGPVGGDHGGDVPEGVFPNHAVATSLTVLTTFGELGFVHRVGGLAAFGFFHVGLAGASLDIESDCECDGSLTATQLVLGPKLGLRGYLSSDFFVQGSVRADLNHFPDWVATIGIGLGQRPR